MEELKEKQASQLAGEETVESKEHPTSQVSGSETDSITALDYIESHMKLEQDARDILPYDPSHCTHYDEIGRQQIFACLTCRLKSNTYSGVCYSCSIRCHSTHDLVELFTKRGFSCDCGTDRMASSGGCNLRKNFDSLDASESTNTYNHNYAGRFCICDSEYHVESEQGVMFQCLLGDACGEDWFHEECILGIPRRKVEKKKSPLTGQSYAPGVNVYDSLEPAESSTVMAPEEQDGRDVHADDDDDHQDDDETLEGLPNQNEFVGFICWQCVEKNRSALDRWSEWAEVAHPGVIRGSFDSLEHRNKVLGIGRKRDMSEKTESHIKKIKVIDENHESKALSATTSDTNNRPVPLSLFLKVGYEDVLKKCKDLEVISLIERFPFLVEDEDVYQPPEDDDAASSLLDAGTRALNSLPRNQALDGMHAYSMIRDRLTMFLRPFAEQGKVVTETDVNAFFAEISENQKNAHSD
jgi:E3 ubiquitin-protein ligase UBR7